MENLRCMYLNKLRTSVILNYSGELSTIAEIRQIPEVKLGMYRTDCLGLISSVTGDFLHFFDHRLLLLLEGFLLRR